MSRSLVSAPVANADGNIELSPQAGREVFARIQRPDYPRFASQQAGTGGCSHPVRLVGSSNTIDAATGEVVGSYDSANEPDHVVYVRCGNRRADVCPSCSAEYAADVWHMLSAGMTGGKGVPEEIRSHPLVFATLTAPSFGAVHSCVKSGRRPKRCHPRSGKTLCPHGRPLRCMRIHTEDDELIGQPICADCYDYPAHVIWHWWAPELWRRFTIGLRRAVATRLGVRERDLNNVVRVQFSKVAEFQRRGVIHFHALIRLDGPATETEAWTPLEVDLSADELCGLIKQAASVVEYTSPAGGRRLPALSLRFGAQVDTRIVHELADPDDVTADGGLRPDAAAGYLAKYATKSATAGAPGSGLRAHLRRVRRTVHRLGLAATPTPPAAEGVDQEKVAPYGRLGQWEGMLGFRGRFTTSSRTFSTTLGALRAARRDHQRGLSTAPQFASDVQVGEFDRAEDATLVVGSWRYVAQGWLTNGDAALAAETAGRARERRVTRAAERRMAA